MDEINLTLDGRATNHPEALRGFLVGDTMVIMLNKASGALSSGALEEDSETWRRIVSGVYRLLPTGVAVRVCVRPHVCARACVWRCGSAYALVTCGI